MYFNAFLNAFFINRYNITFFPRLAEHRASNRYLNSNHALARKTHKIQIPQTALFIIIACKLRVYICTSVYQALPAANVILSLKLNPEEHRNAHKIGN